jgi:hypothetical protein
LPVGVEEEAPKKIGSLLLTLILLGIIGYSGYRVYPQALDLWRRAREPVESEANPAKAESAPQASNPEGSNAKPEAKEAQSLEAPLTAPPAPTTVAAPAENLPARNASQSIAVPASPVKGSEPALATDGTADKSIAPQKPAPSAGPTAAHLLESKLRAELVGNPIADKVIIQTTANALTLSGSLTLAEHRELLRHLRTVPAGVRVIDDTEYAEDLKATPAPASAGWIWVRSTPPSARILVDGAETGLRTPARLELQAGEHEVRLVRRGFGTVHRNVQVNLGQTIQFTETLPTE